MLWKIRTELAQHILLLANNLKDLKTCTKNLLGGLQNIYKITYLRDFMYKQTFHTQGSVLKLQAGRPLRSHMKRFYSRHFMYQIGQCIEAASTVPLYEAIYTAGTPYISAIHTE